MFTFKKKIYIVFLTVEGAKASAAFSIKSLMLLIITDFFFLCPTHTIWILLTNTHTHTNITWTCKPIALTFLLTGLSNCVHYVCVVGLTCGANSTYTTCMTACPASCADLAAPSECEQTSCLEGCQCNPGFTMSKDKCVPYNECGCTYLGRYYTVSPQLCVSAVSM